MSIIAKTLSIQYSNNTELFSKMFEIMYNLCAEEEWGDPFSYARSREIYMANTLGHIIAPEYSGADAYEDLEMKIPVEYKSTICSKPSATYNGISVQPTWEDQMSYLINKKIGCYPRHYFARFNGGKIVEMYCMECDKVLEGLLPKLKKQYHKSNKGVDPRLGAQLTEKYIIEHSTKII
jgi:hypothetical protein